MSKTILKELVSAVEQGDANLVSGLTSTAINQGIPILEIISDGLSKGLQRVGKLFETEDLFLVDLMLSSEAAKQGFELLEPLMEKQGLVTSISGTSTFLNIDSLFYPQISPFFSALAIYVHLLIYFNINVSET